jgi:hypothetical protein
MFLRIFRYFMLAFLAASLTTGASLADWRASGTFKYQDREFDRTGFTGSQPALPIRLARVEVRDPNKNGGAALLATTYTDQNGYFSVNVVDSSVRTVNFRVLTTSSPVPGLYLSVTSVLGQTYNYAIASSNYLNHSPSVNIDMGTLTGVIGSGGEAFNIYDVGLNTLSYIKDLEGAYPGSFNPLTLMWEASTGVTGCTYLGSGVVRVGDPSAYNDTVIQHESGHYARDVYSGTDTPGGVHYLSDCKQDLRLAWDEGYATFFGQAVRHHLNLPNPQLYVKTTGQPGPGNLDFYFDVEGESPYRCDGSSSEMVVQALLWDLIDSSSTPDSTPGTDDLNDYMSGQESRVWDVMRNYVRTATWRTLEDFWDGWFVRNHGYGSAMRFLFGSQFVEFYEDDGEDNEGPAFSKALPNNGIPHHQTYFKDLGNGAGTADTDYFSFVAVAGLTYKIETRNLLGDANTSLVLYKPDGVTQIAANDDRSVGNKTSLIEFAPLQDGTYYIRSFHGSGYGVYGSYDISVTPSNSLVGGTAPPPGSEIGIVAERQIKH